MIGLAVISLIGIIVVQVYWVSQAVSEKEETFDHNVRMSLRAVADHMCQIDGNELIVSKPIDRVDRNYFIARLRYNIDVSVLEKLINKQFQDRDINQDYEYGVYNCENDQMVFGNQVSLASTDEQSKVSIPLLQEDAYYFGVYFPNMTGGLLSQMNIWKFMTAGTMLMIIFFGYGLIVVLKQRRLSEIQKDFIDNMTHELKTPLATLKLTSEALQAQENPEKAKKYANIIEQETSRLDRHVEQVLSSSLLDEEAILIRNRLHVEAFLAGLFEAFKHANEGVKWESSFSNLGEVETNQAALETVVRNLLDNALKYGNGEVGLSAKCSSGQLNIEVSDNGEGIEDKYSKKIFDKFFRIPSDDVHNVKGYGLGMYLVKQNLKRIQGKIQMKRVEEKTIFIVQIPSK